MIATEPRCRGGLHSFPLFPPLYPWSVPYNAECSARMHQVSFLSLWHDSTWDWTQVSRAIAEHSNHHAKAIKPNQKWCLENVMQSLSLLSDQLWSWGVLPVKVLFRGQIRLFSHLVNIIIITHLKPYNCVQISYWNTNFNCPVGWGCRIYRLLLCRGVRHPPNECPGYDTKQFDGEVPAMQELWGM